MWPGTAMCLRLKDGTCITPVLIKNDKLYPEKVGLSTLHDVAPFDDVETRKGVQRLLSNMDYVGLVSVEFSKSASDGKFYFFEFNIRNDGYNPCMTKAGVNINYYYVCDMMDIPFEVKEPHHVHIISEVRHLQSLAHGGMKFSDWVKDLRNSDGFTWYYKNDKKPFYVMFEHSIMGTTKARLRNLKSRIKKK